MSDTFAAYEIVKQGTVTAPVLCCVVTDSVNKVNELVQFAYGPDLYLEMPVFVDDVSSGG